MILEHESFEGFRIRMDKHQYHLQTKKKGRKNWFSVGYFTTMGGAINKMARLKLLDEHSHMNIMEYIKEHERLVKLFKENLNF